MSTKIRLQRHGRKRRPFYYIVIADARAPRDGRYIERIGDYNPVHVPAEINLDVDRALDWLGKGAQPTKTVKAIMQYKGAMYKKHLLRGVSKGAFTLEEADQKFSEWLVDHEGKMSDASRKAKDANASARQLQIDGIRETRSKKQAEAEAVAAEEFAAAAKADADAKAAAEAEAAAAAVPEAPEAASEPAEAAAEPVAEEAPVAEAATEEPAAEVAAEPAAEKGESTDEEKA